MQTPLRLHCLCAVRAVATILVVFGARTAGAGGPEDLRAPTVAAPTWDEQHWREYDAAWLGLRFSIPAAGFAVEEQTHDWNAPDFYIKHTLKVSGAESTAVVVDAWFHEDDGDLDAWFDDHFGFLLEAGHSVWRDVATAWDAELIRVHVPRSPQAFARQIAVLQLGDLVLSVTCQDADNPQSVAIFETVLATLLPTWAPAGSPF